MTSRKTSELGYYVRGSAPQLQGNAALDTAAARFGVIGNLNHLQDEMGQHGASLCMPTSPAFGNPYYTQAAPVVGTYARLDTMPPTFSFLRMQSDGSSSRIQVTVTAYSSSAGTAIRLRAFLQPFQTGLSSTAPEGSAYTTVSADMSTTSGTATVLRCQLYVSRLSDAYLYSRPSTDGAGALSGVQFYAARVELWASSDNVTVFPRVSGFCTREYVG